MRRTFGLFTPVLLGAALSTIAFGTSGNPPDGLTGAPGEVTCGLSLCHGNLNTGGGGIQLMTSKVSYSPKDTIELNLRVFQAGQQRWGFQLTVLDSLNKGVGELLLTDSSRTQKSINVNTRQYARHTSFGTDAGISDTCPGWRLLWVAPDTLAGRIIFYAAGVAANDDSTNSGDYAYSGQWSIENEPTCCLGGTGNVDCDPNDQVDIADLTMLIDFLFISFSPLCCPSEAQLDGQGVVDIADMTVLINSLFITLEPLPDCQ